MTTPNLPQGTPQSNLPQGVVSQPGLGEALQDTSAEAYRSEAASRFPGALDGTLAGGPLAAGPLGMVTRMATRLQSNVANADPASITKPGDLQPLVPGFFNLDLGDGIFGKLLDALMGIGGGGIFTAIASFFSGQWGRVDATETKVQEVQTGILAGWTEGPTEGTDLAVYDTLAAIRNLIVGGGYTRYNVLSSGSWTKPAGVTELLVSAISAGANGANGSGTSLLESGANGGAGGLGGGYKVQSLNVAEVSSLHFTIGTNGGPTTVREGSASGPVLVQAVVGSPGAMVTPYGYTSSNSNAAGGGGGGGGEGGDGGAGGPGVMGGVNGTGGSSSSRGPGGAGGSTPAAVGGTADGGTGASVTMSEVPCGGGGGGGGRGGRRDLIIGSNARGANGGAGGYPGGGGGGGGGSGWTPFGGSGGTGGPGATGVAIIYYR